LHVHRSLLTRLAYFRRADGSQGGGASGCGQYGHVCCSVLHCVGVRCSVSDCGQNRDLHRVGSAMGDCALLQRVDVLQCSVAVWCTALQ